MWPSYTLVQNDPTKLGFFYWRLNLDRLLTKDSLAKKGMEFDNIDCPICHSEPETVNHIFKECSRVQEVWRLINNWWQIFSTDRMELNRRNEDSNKMVIAKKVVWYAFLWTVWKKRNDSVFNGVPFTPSLIANDVQSTAFFWFHNHCKLGSSVSWMDWCCSPNAL